MGTRTFPRRDVSQSAAQGTAGGTFFLTFFGAYWGFSSAVFLSGTFQIISFLLVGLVTLVFLGKGTLLWRQARALPKEPSREDGARGKRIARGFGIIFGLEIVLIALGALLLGLPLAGSSSYHWSLFVGIGTALVLWLTDLFMIRYGWKSMQHRG